jgi:uncharacterized membrane protein YphA (DoxX/SURF4 family)
MRVAIGVIASAQGVLCLFYSDYRTIEVVFTGLVLSLCGACLLIGILTPLVSIFVVLVGLANALSWPPMAARDLFDGKLSTFEMIVMAAAISLLGPGAFSLDARLFGRHRIVIPPVSRRPKS